MVVAASLRTALQGDCCCCCNSRYRWLSFNPFYEPINKEDRSNERRKEWNIWLSSTADDLDLISDWWYFWVTYHGDRGGFADPLVQALGVFCVLGTVTWLLELMQLTCVRPKFAWTWLPLTIILVEDIPQLTITLLIQGRFQNVTPLGLFNIMTSLYSLLIRLAGEVFLNCCYCCERIPEDETESNDVEFGTYKAAAY